MDNPDAAGSAKLGLQMQGGELQRLTPNSSRDDQITTLNNIIDHLNNTLKVQIYSDTNSKRYIQGYAANRWPGGDFGIAISAEGDDVLSVEFDQLIFAWDFSTNRQYFRDGTQLYYEASSGKNVGQVGKLPNNKSGSAWAKDGEDVEDAFGS